jgi:hypothetical protein
MIDLLLALHGLAQQRGDGLHPVLAEGLRKTQRLDDGRLIAIDGYLGAFERSSVASPRVPANLGPKSLPI